MSAATPDGTTERSPAEVVALYPAHLETVPSFLETRTRIAAERPVLQFEPREWTYGELQAGARALATALAARGMGAGDRIAHVSLNSDASVVLSLAVAMLGAIFIPLNPAATDEELGYLLHHARPRMILAQPADLERSARIAGGLVPAPALMSSLELGVDCASAAQALERIAALAGGAVWSPPLVRPDDPVVVIYTSGTTGFPKGVVHTHRSFILAAEGFVSRMHLQPEERLLTLMPFYHINALFYSLGGAIAAGAALITGPRFSASDFWHLAARTAATQFNFLAAIGNILINRPRSEFDPAHRVRKVYGAPISERIYRVFREEFHIPVLIEGYGMSEIPGACAMPYAGPHKAGSLGRVAVHPRLPGELAEMRIVDDNGREQPVGEVGEIAVRTPMMFKEYLDDPRQTAAAFRDGWFLTGDLARRDAADFFYFVARKKDIIRRRGENISGVELDRIIAEHPDVLEAAAIGVPAELGEEEILVAIVPRPQTHPRPEDILSWCRGRLPAMKVPRFITLVDTLPHTPSHRVAKHRLKADPSVLGRAFDAELQSARESRPPPKG